VIVMTGVGDALPDGLPPQHPCCGASTRLTRTEFVTLNAIPHHVDPVLPVISCELVAEHATKSNLPALRRHA
jgi:hypothetical protein